MCKRSNRIVKILALLMGIGALAGFTPVQAEGQPSVSERGVSQIEATRSQLLELTGENASVATAYDRLMELVSRANVEEKSLSSSDVEQICEAVLFAEHQHHAQTRHNAEHTPYVCHPLDVAYDLMQVGHVRELPLILGALLHDVADHKAIARAFGSQVARLVGEVSAHPISARESHQRELMIHAADQSLNSVQIELADLFYSLKELSTSPPPHWNKERVDHYFEWAQSVVDRFPDANQPLRTAVQATIQAYWDRQ